MWLSLVAMGLPCMASRALAGVTYGDTDILNFALNLEYLQVTVDLKVSVVLPSLSAVTSHSRHDVHELDALVDQVQRLRFVLLCCFGEYRPTHRLYYKSVAAVECSEASLSLLQANYYSCAAYGTPLSSTLGGPAPLGCVKGNYSPSVQGLYENLATNEIDHVAYIQAALGRTLHQHSFLSGSSLCLCSCHQAGVLFYQVPEHTCAHLKLACVPQSVSVLIIRMFVCMCSQFLAVAVAGICSQFCAHHLFARQGTLLVLHLISVLTKPGNMRASMVHVTCVRLPATYDVACAGSAAVPQPLINMSALAPAANLALSRELEPPFSYAASDLPGLVTIFFFEDVAVTAYNGAIPLLSSKTIANVAVSVALIEAYHAGIVSCHLCFSTATVYTLSTSSIVSGLLVH